MKGSRVLSALILFTVSGFVMAPGARAEDATAAGEAAPAAPAEETGFPRNYYATILSVGGPGAGGTARMKLILQRWSTQEERQSMMDALKQGGQNALLGVMQKLEVGRLSIDGNLGWPVRLAATRQTPKGTLVRVALDRPIAIFERMENTRSEDYPIGFLEFVMPPDEKNGSGTVVLASRVKVDDTGSIVVESLPGNTAPQRLQNITVDKPKAKKK